MIVSKNALQAVNVTTPDKQIPLLDTVHIREDGGVVAANRDSVVLVSPVSAETKGSFPIQSRESEEVTISAESVRDMIRYIGPDKRFNGLLEHCDVLRKDDKVEVTCYDGKRTKVLEGKCYPEYFNYRELLQRVHTESINVKVTLNRKRLKSLIDTIDKICDDKGDFAPIFFEFTKNGDVLIRSIDAKNGTRILAVSRALPGVKYVDYSPWEKQFISVENKPAEIPIRDRYSVTKDYQIAKEEIMAAKEVKTFVRERKPPVVAIRQRVLPGIWHIIDEKCPLCNCHLRKNEKMKKSCSYVKCINNSKYL